MQWELTLQNERRADVRPAKQAISVKAFKIT